MAVNQKLAERAERKLRPLYDAVDNGQNKKAIQLADKILKKENDFQCARALKAIALLRVGRQEESLNAINTVIASHPGDQATLQACTMYYKENDDFMKIAALYADAAVHYPKNQEILTHLFMAYVRLGDYQKQQQTAIQLHKAFPKSGPYYCWRVMSILMQATDSRNDDKAKQLFLPLAERLVDKYFAECDVDSEAEVKLYLLVLDKLDKTEKKLRVLEGTPGTRLSKGELMCLQVDCLIKLKRWTDAAKKLTELLEKTPDEWSCIKQYISCQIMCCREERLKRMEEAKATVLEDSSKEKQDEEDNQEGSGELGDVSPPEEMPGEGSGEKCCEEGGCGEDSECSWNNLTGSEEYLHPLLETRDLLERLAADELALVGAAERTRYPLRGPLLARMELLHQLFHNKMHNIPLGLVSPKIILADYFSVFGSKGCVFDDLRTFLDVYGKVDNQAVLEFMQHIQDQIDSSPIDFDCPNDLVKENTARLQRHSNLIQLQRYHGCVPYSEDKLLDICRRYYQEGLKLGKHLISTACQPADFYTILAGHILFQRFQETMDIKVMWDAIFQLERAKNTSPQMAVLLMTCYGLVGACENMVDLFQAVSIKHLQIETIGYAPMRFIQSMGTFGFANQLYKTAVRFYYGASKEFSEYIIQAYKNGTFSMIEEFVECRERITHSFNFVNTLTEMNFLEMITTVHSISQAREFFKKDWIPKLPCSLKDYVSSLVDNRDLKVLDDWSPLSEQMLVDQKKLSFELECLWLRARLNLVKSFRDAISIAVSQYRGQPPSQEELERRRLSLVVLVQKVDSYRGTLEDMDKHKTVTFFRKVLRQGSNTRLPLQHPPPCLGYLFLQQGHGKIIFDMLRVAVITAGEDENKDDEEQSMDQAEGLLKGILHRIEVVKSQIHPVPEGLRLSLSKMVGGAKSSPPPSSSSAATSEELASTSDDCQREDQPPPILNQPPILDHPYDILIRSKIDLETYVLLLQTISHLLLLSSVCAEVLTPEIRQEESKKKNRRKKAPTSITLPVRATVLATLLKNFVSEIHQTLTVLSKQFDPLPLPDEEEEMVQRLKCLYIGEDENSPSARDKKIKSSVCGTVLTSYDMSLRDTMQLTTSKLGVAKLLIDQFKAVETNNRKTPT